MVVTKGETNVAFYFVMKNNNAIGLPLHVRLSGHDLYIDPLSDGLSLVGEEEGVEIEGRLDFDYTDIQSGKVYKLIVLSENKHEAEDYVKVL